MGIIESLLTSIRESKPVKCNGPIEVSQGHWICRRNDSECQNRLNGRIFEGTKPSRFEPVERDFNLDLIEP